MYNYRPLRTDEIRLLTVQQSSGGGQIKCLIHRTNLRKAGRFAALSYVWGTPIPRHEILLNGTSFEVGTNLFLALTQLRSILNSDVKVAMPIWVDAICINQSDADEKNVQVPRMGELYAAATRVYCFLTPLDMGPAYQHESTSSELNRSWEVAVRVMTGLDPQINGFQKRQFIKLSEAAVNAVEPQHLLTAFRFFASPYWTRLWIVQEIILATEAYVFAGSCPILMKDIAPLSGLIRDAPELIVQRIQPSIGIHKDTSSATIDTTLCQRLGRSISEFLFYKRVSGNGISHYRTISLFEFARSASATDLRDKVWGMLGLMRPSMAALIHVDYESQSRHQVYRDLTASYVQDWQSIDVLQWWYIVPRKSGDLPSWVVDLENDLYLSAAQRSDILSDLIPGACPNPVTRDDKLYLSGAEFDTIEGLSSVASFSPDIRLSSDDAKLVQNANLNGSKNTIEAVAEQLVEVLKGVHITSDGDRDFHLPTVKFLESESQSNPDAEIVHRFFLGNLTFLLRSGCPLSAVLPTSTPPHIGDEYYHELRGDIAQLANNIYCRRLAVSKSGVIGIVPAHAKKDDLICGFRGFVNSAVLRPTSEVEHEYRWVGVSYFRGLGEMESLYREGKEVSSFVIV